MFDWLWKLLYSLSEILFEIVDGMLSISNRLCGIEPIEVDGQKVNFVDVILNNNVVMYAFGGVALVAIFLLMIFGTIAICRNLKENKKTSFEIFVQVFKTIGMFMVVPALMFGFSSLLNIIVQLIYEATRSGDQTMGQFLFESFRPAGMGKVQHSVDWRSTSSVSTYLASFGYDLSDYRFFFSWIITIPLIFCIAKALFLFIDRTLSIVLLFIFAPISMSTAVLDDGARFKFWRDKVITKFLSGYGMVVAINIYVLVLSFITRPDVTFIPGDGLINWLADFLLRIAFAIGGAYFLPNVFGLVGDLFTNGAASGEFRTAADTMKQMKQDYKDYKQEQRQKKQDKERENEKKKEREKRARNAMNSGRGGGGFGGGGGIGGGSGNQFMSKLGDLGGIGKKVAGVVAGVVGGEAGEAIKKAINEDNGGGDTGGGGDGGSDDSGNGNNSTSLVEGAQAVKQGIATILGGGKGGKQ